MSDFAPLWPGGPVYAAESGFPLCTDSILLADFVRPRQARQGVDLGCGAGILSLLLLEKAPRLHMTGLELRSEAAALARENLRRNGWEERGTVLACDLRDCSSLFPAGAFSLAVANPPYFSLASGAQAPEAGRAGARSERDCSLQELCRAARYLLRSGGSFCLVYRTERLSELFCSLSAAGLEPKRLRLVSARSGAAPKLALVEARRDGRPGLSVEPELLLEDNGAELKRIYHLPDP